MSRRLPKLVSNAVGGGRPVAWRFATLAAFAALLAIPFFWSPESPRAEPIRATPAFDDFEGTVSSINQKDGALTLEVSAASGARTIRLTGLPKTATAIACDKCRIVSRVQHTPRGPSQVITLSEGGKTIAAIGINTAPGAGILAENAEDRSSPAVRLGGPVKPDPETPPPLRLNGPGLDQPLVPGGAAAFNAFGKDWTFHVGRAAVEDTSDVTPSLEEYQVRTDWLLLSKP